jgi:pyrroline-5-carboxylate reductase
MDSQLDKTIAIVGGGTMGSAIAAGLASTGTVAASRVLVADHHAQKRDRLAIQGIRTFADPAQMAQANPDVVVLAVKPQVLAPTVRALADLLAGRLVVSIAAGVTLEVLEALMPGSRVVRAMPNLPVRALSGATVLCLGSSATPEDGALAQALFACLGCAFPMREDQLDAEGAVVSCGPAYLALFVDLLVRAGVEQGLPAQACRTMVLTTMRGVARDLLDSGDHPRAYMEGVTSPGGTTAKGLRAMEGGLMEAVEAGVDAALARTAQLAGRED